MSAIRATLCYYSIGPVGIFLLANVLAKVPNQPACKIKKTPRQFGPSIPHPAFSRNIGNLALSAETRTAYFCKPDVKTTTLFTPLSAHSLITFSAMFSGTEITALSTGIGTDEIFGYAFRPWTISRFGFTGKVAFVAVFEHGIDRPVANPGWVV